MSVTRSEVLSLYKKLLIYSKSVTLTDAAYFKRKIVTEFKRNKDLSNTEEIQFVYQKGQALLIRGAVV